MKLSKANISILISSIALLVVLVIQVNWIVKTAKIKEELFNEKANMVLSKTMDALRADKETYERIDACVENDSTTSSTTKLGQSETQKIDSLFNSYMKVYKLHIAYTFEVTKPLFVAPNNSYGFGNCTYDQTVQDEDGKNKFKLKLILPSKSTYIIEEMGPLFITSVILILVVMIVFWRTTRSLIKEKKISEHTMDFLNNMTHEFKTPLTNISLAGKMISKDPIIEHEDKLKQYSEIILEENEKLRVQVELMLSMTALERGELPLQKTLLDLHELIHESFRSMKIQIDHQHGEVNFDLSAQNSQIMADKTHMKNALVNLIDNAIKYTGQQPIISVQTNNIDHQICIRISDNGIGIEKEYQKKVFDKFFRIPTGDVHNVKGFGLGLAYVKKIIEMHQGTIELHSEKNKGTTFIITIPHA